MKTFFSLLLAFAAVLAGAQTYSGAGGGAGGPILTRLPQWNRALAAVKAGTGNARIMCAGDSLTVGYLANGAGNGFLNCQPLAYPHILTGLLKTALGVQVQDDNFTGNSNVGGSYTLQQYDPRVTGGSGWNTNGGSNTGFGGNFVTSNTAVTALSFTPVGTFDTIEVTVGTTSGGGSATVDIGGGTLATISCNAGSGMARTVVTCARGTHTINFTPTSAAIFYLSSVVCYDSTIKQVIVQTAAGSGATSATWFANASFNGPTYYALANPPDLTIYGIAVNDAITSVATGTTLANIGTGVTDMQAGGGDVILWGWPQPQTSTISTLIDHQYLLQMQTVSAGYYPFVDVGGWMGLYTLANANGYMANAVHLSAAGYAQVAALILPYILKS